MEDVWREYIQLGKAGVRKHRGHCALGIMQPVAFGATNHVRLHDSLAHTPSAAVMAMLLFIFDPFFAESRTFRGSLGNPVGGPFHGKEMAAVVFHLSSKLF